MSAASAVAQGQAVFADSFDTWRSAARALRVPDAAAREQAFDAIVVALERARQLGGTA